MVTSETLLAKWFSLRPAVQDDRLSKGDLAVLYWLLDRESKELGAFPSFARLAEDTRLCRSTVIRSVKRLVEHGYVRIVQRGGRGWANTYRAVRTDLN